MHRFIFHSNKVSFIIEIVILCYFLIGCGTQGHTELHYCPRKAISSRYPTTQRKRIRVGPNTCMIILKNVQKRGYDRIRCFGKRHVPHYRTNRPGTQKWFKVETHANGIKLITSGPKKMLWLQYQIMKKIGDMDKRIESSDLPPALVNLNDTCGSFAFKYQSIYSPTGLHPDIQE